MLLRGTLLVALLIHSTLALAINVGGFDLGRGGPYSISDGSYTADIRTVLSNMFAGTTFSGSGTLTPAYLSNVDLLIVTTAYSNSQEISPLSPAEQTALYDYVLGGGNALILGERADFSPLTNPTLLGPFGLTITGATLADPDATVIDPGAAPFTAGPFGTVTSVSTTNPGWFGDVGLATTVALLDSNGQPVLAYAPENTFGIGSGRVIFSADSDIYTENLALILNSFDYLSVQVPEPSSIALAMLGGLAVAAAAIRRRR
jgi:hypothetical protein